MQMNTVESYVNIRETFFGKLTYGLQSAIYE